ncbi:MAG: NAD(P)/FAD-dependent oxidoreductase [Bacteroidales bacterium]|nr:NAD(P)/FAD-dependent oxidoreductase [Bacteroidales bacterium]
MVTDNNIVVVIGAGASGLMAANVLSAQGKKVILLEKKHQAGLKLRITGKGRCNVTNSAIKQEYLKHISSPSFFASIFDNFSNTDLINFFEKRNTPLVIERGGRVFPKSNKSLDIFLALVKPLEDNPLVEIKKNCKVNHLIIKNRQIQAVETNLGKITANNVIIATGGCSYASTGAEGDGYRLAMEVGHHIQEPLPALVGWRTYDGYPRQLQDFEVKNCEVILTNNDKKVLWSKFGDIYLDEYGVSGPVILSLSRDMAEKLDRGEKLFLTIDYKPKISKEKLAEEIKEVFAKRRTEDVSSVLRKWFAKPLIEDVLDKCRINSRTMAKNLTEKQLHSILWYMKERRMLVVGDMGWKEAIITKGGVRLDEIDNRTMKSKKIKGLSFCGEVLDLDADTGGYNLQIAFSTAVLAAQKI